MMENLLSTLIRLQESLAALQPVLQEENRQLSALKINPVSLQALADHKSRLLAAIAHYDAQRKEQETALHLTAPYAQQVELAARWQAIVQQVKQSNALNQKSGQLLERQMKNASGLRGAMSKAGATVALYGAKGEVSDSGMARAYHISI
ncbi:flagella synthesis protein FlgN [[Erwinia] mediterraneensis]|uniref:flagella synthesis protein FlgN n=1 Tax=[Erwinia] mediterraneensis TaxID=2161819 RepID=UPI00102FF872|nr:flagellar export chaperone FlgN [[Erwinia] mediterraneensis]